MLGKAEVLLGLLWHGGFERFELITETLTPLITRAHAASSADACSSSSLHLERGLTDNLVANAHAIINGPFWLRVSSFLEHVAGIVSTVTSSIA